MTRGVPGPLRRLARQPLRIVSVVLLAGVALAASGIQSAAATALQTTLDANWRGAYDILVTPRDGMDAIRGMLPPNSLSASLEGMTMDDLAKVRTVPGVEIAAPIGDVLLPGLTYSSVGMTVPHGLPGTTSRPQAYRLTATYTTNDGLGERIVARDSQAFVVDETHPDDARRDAQCDAPDRESSIDGHDYRQGDYPALTAYLCGLLSPELNGVTGFSLDERNLRLRYSGTADAYGIALPDEALSATRVTLVDPVAERALLGDAGAFLDPLVQLHPTAHTGPGEVTDWAGETASAGGQDAVQALSAYAAAFATSGGSDTPAAVIGELRRLWAADGDDWDRWSAQTVGSTPVVPLLVSDAPTAHLAVKVDVESFGDAPIEHTEPDGTPDYRMPKPLVDGAAGRHVGSTAADVSSVLNPFAHATGDTIAWPGTEYDPAPTVPNLNVLQGAGRSAAAGYTASHDAIALAASGYRDPLREGGLLLSTAADPQQIGSEAAYQQLRVVSRPDEQNLPVALPVGTFDPTQVDAGTHDAGYVPLGAYDDVDVTVADGDHAGATMQPAVSGTGLVGTRTAAIASIASAPLWHDDAPIDAIRVRVAGIAGYSPQAQQKVVDVARAIDRLGLQATIVAGSSPTDVDIAVTGYAFGTMDPDGHQRVGDLGTVRQRWSELGAAARVDLAVSTATYAVLGIGMLAVLLLAGAVQLAAIPGRRAQAAAMREVGFTRARIARWYAMEEAPGWLIVAAVGGVAVVFAAERAVAAAAVGAVLVLTAVIGATAVIAGSRSRVRPRVRDAASRRIGARSVAGFGARQARVHALSSCVHAVAVVIVGIACAALVLTLLTARMQSGTSVLAVQTWGRMLWPQLALGAAAVVGGLVLARLVHRIDLAQRGAQWALLRAAGWTTGQLAAAQRTEGIVVTVPAVVVAAVAAGAGAVVLGTHDPWLYAIVAAGAGCLAALVTFTGRRRKGRRA
ncbi:hypothetical protein [Microbacterium luticocti]|uniref:hypothetical protein n=1 Tax=Microbacterium luticocti TaxID=451764 RepID=UPI0012EBD586|nr:hypothetical protein [Microbacterium luticocti]